MSQSTHASKNAALQNDVSNVRYALAVASGKGGVGKSTTAVNLAISFAQRGLQVGLLDADIYGPNIPTMMGVDVLPEPSGLQIVPAEAYGIKLVSMGFMVRPDQALIWRGPMLHNAIRQFIEGVAWGDLDILVIDLPPGTGDAQLSLSQVLRLSGGVIVTLPQKVSLEDARRGMQMFRSMDVPVLGIIENMSYLETEAGETLDIFGTGGGSALAQEGGVPLLGNLPIDPGIRIGGDAGKPITVTDPEAAASKRFAAIAGELLQHLESMQQDPGVSIEFVD